MGKASGTSSNPTTGMIQAGVAWATCWRSLIQRLTLNQAKKTIAAAPIIHRICAARGAKGDSTIGKSNRLMGIVPNKLPAIGWRNSVRTAAGAVTSLMP